MTQCFAYKIEGFVQGVFYRATAQREAQKLGLTGFVRNEADGSVFAVACGSVEALTAFEAWLWKGPEKANVTKVTKSPSLLGHFTSFDVQS